MTKPLDPKFVHQTEVWNRNYERLMWGSDEEFREAADAIVQTAVDSHTGYALALGLASVAHTLVVKITEQGQVPVTMHSPRDQADADDLMLAARFVQAVHDRADDLQPADTKPETLVIFEQFESDPTGRMMAVLQAFLVTSLRDMGQQLEQALRDAEARA